MRNMSKKKILIMTIAIITIIATLAIAVPVFADSNTTPTPPTQITTANKPGALIRLLLVQDESKVDAYIATAVSDGKITSDQAVKIKDFWTAHHAQFAKNVVLKRLLSAQNESNVKAFLDKAVANGKITQDQANKIISVWEVLHSSTKATTSTAAATTTTTTPTITTTTSTH
jgi:hypothetical protein